VLLRLMPCSFTLPVAPVTVSRPKAEHIVSVRPNHKNRWVQLALGLCALGLLPWSLLNRFSAGNYLCKEVQGAQLNRVFLRYRRRTN
jgi:hypothetical protein